MYRSLIGNRSHLVRRCNGNRAILALFTWIVCALDTNDNVANTTASALTRNRFMTLLPSCRSDPASVSFVCFGLAARFCFGSGNTRSGGGAPIRSRAFDFTAFTTEKTCFFTLLMSHTWAYRHLCCEALCDYAILFFAWSGKHRIPWDCGSQTKSPHPNEVLDGRA